MRRLLRIVLAAAAVSSCKSAPPTKDAPEPPISKLPLPKVVKVVEVAEVPAPPPELKVADYAAAFRKALMTRTRGRAVGPASTDSITISVLRPKKKILVATSTLGARRRNLSGLPAAEQRIELVAHLPRASTKVIEVLMALAPMVFRADEPLRLYEAVELEPPMHGLAYFDVVPGGEVTVLGERITLYKVVPLSDEEYKTASSSKGSQWVGADRDAAGRTLHRWRLALDPR